MPTEVEELRDLHDGEVPPNPFETFAWEDRVDLWTASKDRDVFYMPQDYQEVFHRATEYDIKIIGGGIGAGKTTTPTRDYSHEIFVGPERKRMGYSGADGFTGRIAIVGPNYDLAQAPFNFLMQTWGAVDGIAEISTPKNRQWQMTTKTGIEVFTISATEPQRFAGRPYTVVHMTEAAQMPEEMFLVALERLNRWKMPWVGKLYLEGTFEEDALPWYSELCKKYETYPNEDNARFFKFKSWYNRKSYKGGWDDPKIQAQLRLHQSQGKEKRFYHRYGGDPPPVPGELWGDWFDPDTHLSKSAAYIPGLPVDVAFDPAYHRYSILFFQWPDERTCNIIGELVMRKVDFHLIHKAFWQLPWARDIRPGKSLIVCDIAGTQNHQGLGTTVELWKAPRKVGGMGLTPVYEYLHQRDQLQVVQTALGGEHYQTRINPACSELVFDFRQERLDANGVLNAAKNVGKDDCRKTLSYYLAKKKGIGLDRRARPKSKRPRGSGNSMTI